MVTYLQQHKECRQSEGLTARGDGVHICKINERWCTLCTCPKSDDAPVVPFAEGLVKPVE